MPSQARGCVSMDEFSYNTNGLDVSLFVYRYSDDVKCTRDYDELRRVLKLPIYKEGSYAGFSYTVSKAWSPPSRAEVPGLVAYLVSAASRTSYRVTHVWIMKNITVAAVEITTPSDKTVDLAEVVRGINSQVEQW